MKPNHKIGWLLLFSSIAGAVVLWRLNAGAAGPDALANWLTQMGSSAEAPWIAFGSVVLSGLFVFPAAPSMVFAGALLGNNGYLVGGAGMLFAAVTGYTIGRNFGANSAQTGAAGKMLALIQKYGGYSAIFARWIPGVPFSVQNLLLGAAKVPLLPFVLGSAIGIGVITFLYVSIGVAGVRALPEIQKALRYGWIIPAVGSLCGLYLLMAKAKPAAASEKAEPVR